MLASSTPEEVKKHVKVYITVFASLAFLTVLTVAVAYLHLPIHYAILVALAIAFLKGGLVAGYFMHLVSERTIIYSILALTLVFLVFLMSISFM